MNSNLDKYKADLDKLISLGQEIKLNLIYKVKERDGSKITKEEKEIKAKLEEYFETYYQKWYTEAIYVIRQLIPERLNEFEILYKGDGKRKTIDAHTYNIQDWIVGRRSSSDYSGKKYYDDFGIVIMNYNTQYDILNSAKSRFESTLFNIRQIVQADLFDSELETAKELQKNGFMRAAGAIAGVVLEKHLDEVCFNHSIKISKKNPCISDYNDLLKNNNVIEIPIWRLIQRLGDLRNLCDHKKEREPQKDDINDLIVGVEKITKTLY